MSDLFQRNSTFFTASNYNLPTSQNPINASFNVNQNAPFINKGNDYQMALTKSRIPLDNVPLTNKNIPLKTYGIELRQGNIVTPPTYVKQLNSTNSNFLYNLDPVAKTVVKYSYTSTGALTTVSTTAIPTYYAYGQLIIDDYENFYFMANSNNDGSFDTVVIVIPVGSTTIELKVQNIIAIAMSPNQSLYVASNGLDGSFVYKYSNTNSSTSVSLNLIGQINTNKAGDYIYDIACISVDEYIIVGYAKNQITLYDSNLAPINDFQDTDITALTPASAQIASSNTFIVTNDKLNNGLIFGVSSGNLVNCQTGSTVLSPATFNASPFTQYQSTYTISSEPNMYGVDSAGKTLVGNYSISTNTVSTPSILDSTITAVNVIPYCDNFNFGANSSDNKLYFWGLDGTGSGYKDNHDDFYITPSVSIKQASFKSTFPSNIYALGSDSNFYQTNKPYYPKQILTNATTTVNTNVGFGYGTIGTPNGTTFGFQTSISGLSALGTCIGSFITTGGVYNNVYNNSSGVVSFVQITNGVAGTVYTLDCTSTLNSCQSQPKVLKIDNTTYCILSYNGDQAFVAFYNVNNATNIYTYNYSLIDGGAYASAWNDGTNSWVIVFYGFSSSFYDIYKISLGTVTKTQTASVPNIPISLIPANIVGFETLYNGTTLYSIIVSTTGLLMGQYTYSTSWSNSTGYAYFNNTSYPTIASQNNSYLTTSNTKVGEFYIQNPVNPTKAFDAIYFNPLLTNQITFQVINTTISNYITNIDVNDIPITFVQVPTTLPSAGVITSFYFSYFNVNEMYLLNSGDGFVYKCIVQGGTISNLIKDASITVEPTTYITFYPSFSTTQDYQLRLYKISDQSLVATVDNIQTQIIDIATNRLSNNFQGEYIVPLKGVSIKSYNAQTLALSYTTANTSIYSIYAKDGEDISAGDVPVYTFSQLVTNINLALAEAYAKLIRLGGTLTEAPSISLNYQSGFVTLNYSSDYTNAGNNIMFNKALLSLLYFDNIVDKTEAGYYDILLPSGSTSLVQTVLSIWKFNQLDKIVFISNSLTTYGANLYGNNASSNVIADFDVPTNEPSYLLNNLSNVVYFQPNIYNPLQLNNTAQLNTIDISVYYQMLDGTQYPLQLSAGQSFSSKLIFSSRL